MFCIIGNSSDIRKINVKTTHARGELLTVRRFMFATSAGEYVPDGTERRNKAIPQKLPVLVEPAKAFESRSRGTLVVFAV